MVIPTEELGGGSQPTTSRGQARSRRPETGLQSGGRAEIESKRRGALSDPVSLASGPAPGLGALAAPRQPPRSPPSNLPAPEANSGARGCRVTPPVPTPLPGVWIPRLRGGARHCRRGRGPQEGGAVGLRLSYWLPLARGGAWHLNAEGGWDGDGAGLGAGLGARSRMGTPPPGCAAAFKGFFWRLRPQNWCFFARSWFVFTRFRGEADSSAQWAKPRDCEPQLAHCASLEHRFPVFSWAEPLSWQEAGVAQWGVKRWEDWQPPRLKTEIMRPLSQIAALRLEIHLLPSLERG